MTYIFVRRACRVSTKVSEDNIESIHTLSIRFDCTMFVFRHGGRRAAILTPRCIKRAYATRIDVPMQPPPVPIIEGCPAPTCQCRETPEGLDIEREQNINGSMAAYAEQVLISTGRNDWTSRIEDEDEGVLVRQLKSFLTRNGKYSDVRDSFLR